LQASFGTPRPPEADYPDTIKGSGEMTHMTPLELRITLKDLQDRADTDRGRRVLPPSVGATLARFLERLLRGPGRLRSALQTPKETHP
jgi:hypothetical protein